MRTRLLRAVCAAILLSGCGGPAARHAMPQSEEASSAHSAPSSDIVLPAPEQERSGPAAIGAEEPARAEMTPENQEYAEKYLRAWGGVGDVMSENFSEENMAPILGGNLTLLFHNLDYLEAGGGKYESEEAFVPADVVEDLVTRRFPVTAEQVRGMMPSRPYGKNSDYYDPERRVYVMHSGYGGAGCEAVVTASSLDGDLLTLDCSWYSAVDGTTFCCKTRLTIKLQDDGDFMYIQNEILS